MNELCFSAAFARVSDVWRIYLSIIFFSSFSIDKKNGYYTSTVLSALMSTSTQYAYTTEMIVFIGIFY